jgi:hypothetical protein
MDNVETQLEMVTENAKELKSKIEQSGIGEEIADFAGELAIDAVASLLDF